MKKYCFINGKITEEKNACISPFDLGVLRGYGVFDFMCTANGKPFLFHDHWIRFVRSAKSLGITVPIEEKKCKKIIETLIKKNPYKNPAIRIVLTAGKSIDGMTLSQKPTLFILTHDLNKLLPKKETYKNGAKLITHDFMRENALIKTTNYIEAIKKQREKTRRGAIEILYTHHNTVLECTTSNIFIIKNNTIITPKDTILPGITRKIVLQLARKNKIKTREKKITTKQLFDTDEVFITGSAKHIMPIVKIDTKKIGNGKPGEITKHIMKIYQTYINTY